MNKVARLFVPLVLLIACCAFFVGRYTRKSEAADDLSAKDARNLIAKMAGMDLPSDKVRVRSVSKTGSTAIVEAQVETAFRFVKTDGKWRVAEIRTGDNRWEDVEVLARSIDVNKTEIANAEMEMIAKALDDYRRAQNGYVVSKDFATLIDNLNPRFLCRIIRYDPWHKPYLYEGTQTSYTIRSSGPDRKENTADDIVKML